MKNLEKQLEGDISQSQSEEVVGPVVAPAQVKQQPMQVVKQVAQQTPQQPQINQQQPNQKIRINLENNNHQKQAQQKPVAPQQPQRQQIPQTQQRQVIQEAIQEERSCEEELELINNVLAGLGAVEVKEEPAPTPKKDEPSELTKLIERKKAEAKAREAEKAARESSHRIEGKPVVEETTIKGKPKVYAPVEIEIPGADEEDEEPLQVVEEKKERSPLELLEWAETSYADEWLETYEKGQKSKKNNEVAKKIKQGRFRINKEHQIEILPDKRTDGMSSKDLLEQRWF